jgi:response regulator RpfG family c-di-GMP phosphodiesterase
MNRRILFVDDEPEVLRALERSLFDKVEVTTATSGAEAERILATDEPYAVIVSDMRMPTMDGATLLARIRKNYPDVSRILLTGYADFKATLQAVNEGNIFRFLVKPCPEELLERALEDGIAQHALILAERELLERTLMGAVAALAEVLSVVDPALFNRASRIEKLISSALNELKYEPRWPYEMAAKLSQLGCVALPREIVQRVNSSVAVSEKERTLFESHPETANRILRSIPRLEVVADVIRYQFAREVPKLERREVSQGVELLRAAVTIDALIQKGSTRESAIEAVVRRKLFDESVVRAFGATDGSAVEPTNAASRSVTVAQLKVGMVLLNDVVSTSGAVVVPAGREVTDLVLERLRKFSEGVGISEPIYVQGKR